MPELYSQILDLKEKDVFLETEINDTRYFSISGLPSTLSYGKHPFSITFNDPEGQPLLKNLSNIVFEFVDSRGVVIFSNLINISELSGAGNGFVWIKKDPLRTSDEIADGPAFFYVMGELNGPEIPNEWKGIYNVRTTFTYDIRKDFPNTSPLILKSPIDIQTNLNISESIDFDSEDDVFKRSFININLSDLETNGGEISNVELSYNEQNASTEDFNIITLYTLDSGSFETTDQTATSGLNPITNTTKIEIPNEFRRNTPVKFKLRFQNPAGQFAQHLDEDKQGQIIEVTSSFISFEGAPLFIEREDNLLSGSLFTGNAVGKGFEQSGKGSAFLKTVDYDGFISASAGSGSAGILFFSGSVLPNSGDNYDGVGLELHGGKGSGSFRFRTNPSLLEIEANTFFIGNETTQFVSGSNSNIEISSSLFHLDPKNELLVIGADAIINADLTVTNIRTPATIAGAPSTDQNASSSITSQGFAKFVSASIGGFDVGEGGFSLGSTNVNIDSLNKAITINNGTFGQTGVQLDYNGGTPRAFIGKSSGEFFKFDGSSVNISSSAFFLGSSEQFVSGSNGNIEISSSNFHLDPSNNIMIMSGTIQASDGNIGNFQIIDGKISGSNITFDANNSSIFKTDQGPGSDTSAAFDQLRDEYYIDFTPSSSTDPEGTEYYIKMGPNFMVDKSGILIASGAFFEGTVSASAGFLGGFIIESSSIHSKDYSVSISGSPTPNGFFISSSNFNVKGNGNITGSQVLFTGGTIGGFSIDDHSLTTTGVEINDSTQNLFISSSEFKVKHTGEITGSNVLFDGGTIGGFTIDADEIKSTNIIIDSNNERITVGSSNDVRIQGGGTDNFIAMGDKLEGFVDEGSGTEGILIGMDGSNPQAEFVKSDNNYFIFDAGIDIKTDKLVASGSTIELHTPKFFFGSPNQFVSGSNGNIEISSSNFHLDAAGNVDMSGTITATAGEIGGFTIGDDLSSTSGTLKLKGASGQITGSSVLFTGGKIAGFTISGDTLTATNFTLDASGKRITLGSSNTIFIADADEGIQLGNATFSSAPFSVTTAGVLKATSGTIGGFTLSDTTISSSGLLLESTGKISGSQVNFTGGTVGGFTLSDTQITSNNLIMDSVGTLRTSDYATNERGWRISSEGNGLAEFENVRIRGTLSTAVFEKETINAVGGQLYVANSTALTGSGLISASFTTMSVVNVTGFEQNEILSLKKQTNSGFLTEYILVNSSSRDDNTSETNFAGKLFVTRGYGSGSIGDSGSLGGTPQNSQSYEPGQVLVSTGKQGTGFIRLNANPNDSSTPYIDVVERTGNNIYDVELKARFGDLSGVAGTRNVPSDFTGFGLMSEVAFLSGSNIKLETPRFLLGDLTSAFVSGSNGNIEISSSNLHLTPEGSITASKGLFENVRIVGGAADNIITPFNFANPGFIGGGKSNEILNSNNSFLGGGQQNEISSSDESVVVGGFQNKIESTTVIHSGSSYGDSNYSGILGGRGNELTNPFLSTENVGDPFAPIPVDDFQDVPVPSERSIIVGGSSNTLQSSGNSVVVGGNSNRLWLSPTSVLAGGSQNRILSSDKSFIGGGQNNYIQSQSLSVIAGGEQNRIGQLNDPNTKPLSGFGSDHRNFVGGGYSNKIHESQNGVIVGGYLNTVTSSFGSSILNGNLNIVDSSSYSIIGGGYSNELELSYYSAIVAGYDNNSFSSSNSLIGAGNVNKILDSSNGFIGGGSENEISKSSESAIVGGKNNDIGEGSLSFIGGGEGNTITDSVNSFLGGGEDHEIINSDESFIGGGKSNDLKNKSEYSFIGGGESNDILSGSYAFIGGGNLNLIHSASYSTIAAGKNNEIIDGIYNSILSGRDNDIYNVEYSAIAGGYKNVIDHAFPRSSIKAYHFIGGGQQNKILGKAEQSNAIVGGFNATIISSSYAFIGAGQRNRILSSNQGSIGGGYQNHISGSQYATIAGGQDNRISDSNGAAILAGVNNNMSPPTYSPSPGAIIAGGENNKLHSARYSSLLGGELNIISSSFYSSLIGGSNNTIIGNNVVNAFLGGGASNELANSDNSFLGGGVSSSLSNAPFSSLVGGSGNEISSSDYSGILGGSGNSISSSTYSTVIGGLDNSVFAHSSASSIVGGQHNIIDSSSYSSIVGGRYNKIENDVDSSFIGGGEENYIKGDESQGAIPAVPIQYAFIGGGFANFIIDDETSGSNNSAIVGGQSNKIKGNEHSFIGGGHLNEISLGFGGVALSSLEYNSIVGGQLNRIYGGSNNTIVAGRQNEMNNATSKSFIGGGDQNKLIESSDSAIVAGIDNRVVGSLNAFIGGGEGNKIISSSRSTILSGILGEISDSPGATIVNAASSGTPSTINSGSEGAILGGGFVQTITNTPYSSLLGGNNNSILSGVGSSGPENSIYSFIGGGFNNVISNSNASVVCGGNSFGSFTPSFFKHGGNGTIMGSDSAVKVGGSYGKIVKSDYSFIGSGDGVAISGSDYGVIVSGEGGSGNWRVSMITSPRSFMGSVGSYTQISGSPGSFIGTGGSNKIDGSSAGSPGAPRDGGNIIVGGSSNSVVTGEGTSGFAYTRYSTVVGGFSNKLVGGSYGFIGGGSSNRISASVSLNSSGVMSDFNVLVGGQSNTIFSRTDSYNFIGGGQLNKIMNNGTTNSNFSTIVGGNQNGILGSSKSTILGGQGNEITGSSHIFVIGSNIVLNNPESNTTFVENLSPGTDNSFTLGTSDLRWSDVHAVQTTTGGVFETGLRTDRIGDNPTGTIVSWREDGLVPCDSNEDELVMGVIKEGKDEPIVLGAEPVLVTGKVDVGDYIVTSDKIGHGKAVKRGYLLKKDLFGKVIAQALEPSDDSDSCLIKCMIRKM